MLNTEYNIPTVKVELSVKHNENKTNKNSVTELSKEVLTQSNQQQIQSMTGVDLARVKSINLNSLRNATLPKDTLFWILVGVPIIGWIALACLKIKCISAHEKAEKLMNGAPPDETIENRVHRVSTAAKLAGPISWQYRLELAKLQLLKGDAIEANQTLTQAKFQRGSPTQTGWYNVK